MRDKKLIEERMQKLIEMTDGFCDKYLDEDYKQLCEKLLRNSKPLYLQGFQTLFRNALNMHVE